MENEPFELFIDWDACIAVAAVPSAKGGRVQIYYKGMGDPEAPFIADPQALFDITQDAYCALARMCPAKA